MDSCPGYLYASLCGPAAGAAVAFVGHLASALTAGFPLGVPFHLLVAGEMALCASVYGAIGFSLEGFRAVSYTHLDVYKRQVITMPVLLVLFLITGVLSLGTGAVEFNAGEVARAVIAGLNGQMRGLEITPRETIIFYIRLPRVILAAMTGAALAASGAVYQGIFRNPMADPYVMGTSAGASLGATCAFMLPINIGFLSLGSVPLLAFAGSLVAVMLVSVSYTHLDVYKRQIYRLSDK